MNAQSKHPPIDNVNNIFTPRGNKSCNSRLALDARAYLFIS